MFNKKHLTLQTLINHTVKRRGPLKKFSTITWGDSKNSLITKLLTNVNFVIFHKQVI